MPLSFKRNFVAEVGEGVANLTRLVSMKLDRVLTHSMTSTSWGNAAQR